MLYVKFGKNIGFMASEEMTFENDNLHFSHYKSMETFKLP